jgi:DNA primase
MFPIWNERGKTIAFGGRAVTEDAQPKYLNSPESPLYAKSHVLYALHLARDAAQKTKRLVVVEGYFDCLSLHQAGIENVVASCGTSLTLPQVDIMARYVPEVVMNYDPDTAGRNAMRRSIDLLLAKALRIRILRLPDGLDPDDFVRKRGGQAYKGLLTNAPYFWQYLIDEYVRCEDLADPAVKANAVADVVQYVAKIQDPVERYEIAREIAESFKIPENVVLDRLNLTARRPDVRPTARTPVAPASNRRLTLAEKQLIQALLQNPQIALAIQPFWERDFFSGIWSGPVLEELVKNPLQNIETVLEHVQDEELKREVRAAVLEPFGSITGEQALASMKRLYDAHLVQKLEELRTQLNQYGSGAAPAELVRKHMEIVAEKNRIGAFRP